MKKHSKGFTLVELLVVIGILGLLMGVLLPKIAGAMGDAKQLEVKTKGLALYKQIMQAGIKSYEKDAWARWPRSAKNKSDDDEDISGKTFGSSTEYFVELLDIKKYGTKNWRPLVKDITTAELCGSGVPTPKPGQLEPRNVMWCIAQGVSDNIPDVVPILVTRNGDVTKLFKSGDFNGRDKTEVGVGKENGGESDTPFGKDSFVVVRRGGAVDAIDSAEATLQKIYNGQQFSISDESGFDYLKTGASE